MYLTIGPIAVANPQDLLSSQSRKILTAAFNKQKPQDQLERRRKELVPGAIGHFSLAWKVLTTALVDQGSYELTRLLTDVD